jgi:ADP-L-glycero-D-manno-heptose 6-epimerase
VSLLDHCQNNDIPLLYASSASVYGAGTVFREQREHEAPLNVYGYSKFLFDQYVRRVLPERTAPIVGFRYFNVYGPREQHKGRMASVAFHFFQQYRSTGRVELFDGSGGYSAGEQRRDFVFVDDVVAANLAFLAHPERSGIYNLGSGRAQTFNEVAVATINACRATEGQPPLTLVDLVRAGTIDYVEFPPQLVGKYQSFTQADLSALRGAGYQAPMTPVERGVAAYVERLMADNAAPAVT